MKVYEILSFNRELLIKLERMGIRYADCKYVDMYREYLDLCAEGHKKTYIVAVLSEKYSICERQVYIILDRLGCDCMKYSVVPPAF